MLCCVFTISFKKSQNLKKKIPFACNNFFMAKPHLFAEGNFKSRQEKLEFFSFGFELTEPFVISLFLSKRHEQKEQLYHFPLF